MGGSFLSQRAVCFSDLKAIQPWYLANRCVRTKFSLTIKEVKNASNFKITTSYRARSDSLVTVSFSANAQPRYEAERSKDVVESAMEYEGGSQNGRPFHESYLRLEKHRVDLKNDQSNVNAVEDELRKAPCQAFGGAEIDATVTDIAPSKIGSYNRPDESCRLAVTDRTTESNLQVDSRNRSKLVDGVLKELREVHGAEIATILLALRRFGVHFSSLLRDALKRVGQKTRAQQEGEDLSFSKVVPEEDADEHNQTVLASVPRKASRIDKINWDSLRKIWNEPSSDKIRVLVSITNFAVSVPTFLTRTLPSISKLHWPISYDTISLSVLAPLLFGGGMFFKSTIERVGSILPRIGISFVLLWVLLVLHSVGQQAIVHLKEKASVERSVSNSLSFFLELTFNAAVTMTILASMGVNLSSLFVPSVLALALAGKDVWQNHAAGFSLFITQPFRPGQTLSVPCDYLLKDDSSNTVVQSRPGWFEGVCETVDLRYTVLRNEQTRLIIPNSKFINQAFMIVDTVPCVAKVVTKKRSAKSKEKPKCVKGAINAAADQSASEKHSLVENHAATSDEAD